MGEAAANLTQVDDAGIPPAFVENMGYVKIAVHQYGLIRPQQAAGLGQAFGEVRALGRGEGVSMQRDVYKRQTPSWPASPRQPFRCWACIISCSPSSLCRSLA